MKRALFHPMAERELLDAARFHELGSPGLGVQFLAAAERCELALLEYPRAGATVSGEIRRSLLHGFPYAFLYRAGRDGIRILALMCLLRRPMWGSRAGPRDPLS